MIEEAGGSLSSELPQFFLKVSIATLLFGAIVAVIGLRIFAPEQMVRSLAPLVVSLIALTGWYLLRRGKVHTAKLVLAFGAWVAVAGTAFFTEGVRAPVVVAFPMIILIAAWLISSRAALALGTMTVAATFALVAVHSWGVLPGSLPSSPLLYAADQSVVYILSTVLAIFLVRSYQRRVDEMRKVITERAQAQSALRAREERFELLFNRASEGILIMLPTGAIVAANESFARMHGYRPHEMETLSLRELDTPDTLPLLPGRLKRILAGETLTFEVEHYHKDGHIVPLEVTSSLIVSNGESLIQAFHRDITERKLAEARINNLAFYDPLTNLPNRRLLMDRLAQACNAGARHQQMSALLFIDLDNFKTLNDTLGHHQGDILLTQVAQRLSGCVREGDTVARLGSDEFVVILEDLSRNEIEAATQTKTISEKILTTLNQDHQLDHCAYHGSCSIGITLFGGRRQESNEEPLKRAELAMYEAKAVGRNAMRFFDPQMQVEVANRLAMEADLREAVQNQQFVLYYQVQVVGSGRPIGVESLIRWQHPLRGLVSPAEFIPLAEETGLILPMGQWVLESACRQLALWASRPEMEHLSMAVNVSARQFHQKEFVDQVVAVLEKTGANPKRLKLELTESMLVKDVEDMITKMGTLKMKGVSFSLDDFGTGYSSLSYLKRLPLDQLKIDQGFVKNILTDPNDSAIARTIVALANSLGLSVIAEGVEIEAQLAFLAGLGCHAYQGYLFSRPMPMAALETHMQQLGWTTGEVRAT
jgi:diguanylate cyclase (GGDEF)-like protein/PAS domain S-box-containing protein